MNTMDLLMSLSWMKIWFFICVILYCWLKTANKKNLKINLISLYVLLLEPIVTPMVWFVACSMLKLIIITMRMILNLLYFVQRCFQKICKFRCRTTSLYATKLYKTRLHCFQKICKFRCRTTSLYATKLLCRFTITKQHLVIYENYTKNDVASTTYQMYR